MKGLPFCATSIKYFDRGSLYFACACPIWGFSYTLKRCHYFNGQETARFRLKECVAKDFQHI